MDGKLSIAKVLILFNNKLCQKKCLEEEKVNILSCLSGADPIKITLSIDGKKAREITVSAFEKKSLKNLRMNCPNGTLQNKAFLGLINYW